MATTSVTELIGVYDADGSLRGELAYALRKVVGRAHCALCDITHGGLRRRPEFTRVCADLGVPFTLLHRDDRPADVLVATDGRTPVVLGRTTDGLAVLLGADQLEACGSSPEAMATALRAAMASVGLRLAA